MNTTTSTGTTVSLWQEAGVTLVVLTNPAAPEDMRQVTAGRVMDGHYQAPIFMPFAMSPEVLRILADLIDSICPSCGGEVTTAVATSDGTGEATFPTCADSCGWQGEP